MIETNHLRQQLDTIEDPHSKHTIEDQSWTTPLKNCVNVVFFYCVLIRHPIFWEIRHFENSKKNGAKKEKKEKSISQGKERRERF